MARRHPHEGNIAYSCYNKEKAERAAREARRQREASAALEACALAGFARTHGAARHAVEAFVRGVLGEQPRRVHLFDTVFDARFTDKAENLCVVNQRPVAPTMERTLGLNFAS